MFSRRFRNLGPGIITGAADDDPSGIATYSQAGAQFGLGLLWTPIFLLPLLLAIQEICARIGLVTGTGIISLMKKKYPKKLNYPLISLLAIANTINLGADLNSIGVSKKRFNITFLPTYKRATLLLQPQVHTLIQLFLY